MEYHPIIGILIFLFAVLLSFMLGRYLVKKRNGSLVNMPPKKKKLIQYGDITSPDAPWLDKK
jgi:UPF0716 family protein affecting phage T7 exclusion